MSENLPVKRKNNLFNNIKNFFKSLFFKNNKNCENEINNKIKNFDNDNAKKDKFINSIKIAVNNDIQKEIERNQLFEKIRKNPKMLDMLSLDQLDKLSKYYDKVIEKKDKIIAKKRAMIENLKKNN